MIKTLFQNTTLRRKLTAIIMLTSILALLMMLCAMTVREYIEARRKIVSDFFTYAAVIADNSKAAITFNNKADAENILSALHATRAAVFACIYDTEGNVFADYHRSDLKESIQPPKLREDGFIFQNGCLDIFKRIVLDGETIGTIYLQAELCEIYRNFFRDLITSIIIAFGILILAYFVSSKLQKVISDPILNLAETATSISEKRDYSIRVAKTSNDEIGLLTESFNKMLEQIQQRDAALTDSNEQLEEKVRERTADLTAEVAVRKEAEEKLSNSEKRFKRVAENAGEWIWEVNAEGLYTYSSPAVEKILGYKPEDVVGKMHFYDFFESHEKQNLKEAAFRMFSGRTCFRDFINASIHKNGSTVILETIGTPVLDEQENLCGYCGVDRDITERKQREKELRDAQEELLDASRRAGMAEVATDVLHNVGNVLNSINVSTTLINDTLSHSEVPNLKKVTDMIEEHLQDLNVFLTEDPKGRYVPSYLIKASKLLANQQKDVMGKLGSLVEDVNHIKGIIKMQQEYAKVSGVEVPTTIDKVIEDAIRINQAGLTRHKIQIVREYGDLGEVGIDKQRVIQILVNLMGNAKYALAESACAEKILTIRACKQNENHLRIEVIDNGIGIPPENLTKIFRHGFTTKKDGHGFGLHSGALAAKEMNGSLTAYSNGLGHGATFTLELPFKPVGALQWTT